MAARLTNEHPRWDEFIDALSGPQGCDFQDDGSWHCAGGRDKSKAIAIIERMGNIDLMTTLDYFDDHGGHCDCEIVFNVDKREL